MLALLDRVGKGEPAAAEAQQPAVAPRRRWPSLPGPRISAVLVLVFVAFGALLGRAASPAGRLTAATSPALKLYIPHAAASTQAPKEAGAGGSGSESATEPESGGAGTEAETPAIAKTTTTAKTSTEQSAGTGTSSEEGASSEKPAPKLTDVKHVFLIVLSDEPYAADFGPESKARYLAHTLEAKGELLAHYDAIAHERLPNAVALISGQGPTSQTAADCPTYAAIAPGDLGKDEQALGEGCVYPATVQTLPGELAAKHLTWRAYVQGMDEPGSTAGACSHPALGANDPSDTEGLYATARNPFVYFQSILQSPACQAEDVGLSRLGGDLASAAKTPNLSYIVPDRCHDGDATPCSPGASAGPADVDPFLEQVVPKILASPAYKKNGLLVITTDEAPSSGEFADSSTCCGQPAYPNYTSPQLNHGGGSVGALLLSPFVKGATSSQEPYNHFSLLRTIEDVFGLRHIGYAALPTVSSFAKSLLNGEG